VDRSLYDIAGEKVEMLDASADIVDCVAVDFDETCSVEENPLEEGMLWYENVLVRPASLFRVDLPFVETELDLGA
jgi:hypothetical protein